MKGKSFFLIILVFALIGVGAYWYIGKGAAENTGGATQPSAVGGIAVSAITLSPQEIIIREELPGRTAPYKVSEIRPQVGGIIIERNFEEGSQVEKGQLLYRIDPAPYQAAYERARAALQSVRAAVGAIDARAGRYEELLEFDAVSRQEYDDAVSSLDQARAAISTAEAEVKTAKVNLDYTRVSAPISGRIGKSTVTEGALVTAGQNDALASITQLDPIYVDLNLPSARLFEIRQSLESATEEIPVRLRMQGSDAYYEQEGALQFSDVTVNPSTGSVELRALFPNPDQLLLSGMFVEAELILGRETAFLVPQQAAVRDPQGQLSVWVVNADNIVQPQPITASGEYESSWIVRDGLGAGTMIVTQGFQKIAPGATVTPETADVIAGDDDTAANMTDEPAQQEGGE